MPDPRIFICYRRDDSPSHAHRLHDALVARFGGGAVFVDLQTPGGAHVVDYLTKTIRSSAVLLVVIGPRWLSLRDARGRRLDNDDDYVRLEILTAREQGAAILPVRVAGAAPPPASELPEDLRFLAGLNAPSIGDGAHWSTDVQRLAANVEEILHPGRVRRRRRRPVVLAGLVAAAAVAAATASASGLIGGEPRAAAKTCGDGSGDPARGIYCVTNPCEEYSSPCRLPAFRLPKGGAVAETFEDNAQIRVACQTRGELYRGHHGVDTNIWDRLDSGHYVNDYFVNTGGRGALDPEIPVC